MEQELDIRACRRLLVQIGDMCDHASLTGTMADGARRTAERYNVILRRLEDAGAVGNGLFDALPEGVGYGEIGVEARMLAAYLKTDDKHKHGDEWSGERNMIVRLAPFIGAAELQQLIQDQAAAGSSFDIHTITALAPFLGPEYLSKIVRENLLKSEAPATSPDPAPSPPAAPPRAEMPVPVEPANRGISHLLDLLQDPALPERERQHIVDRIRIATGEV